MLKTKILVPVELKILMEEVHAYSKYERIVIINKELCIIKIQDK